MSYAALSIVLLVGAAWLVVRFARSTTAVRKRAASRPIYVTVNGKTRGPFASESKAIVEGLKDL